MGSQDFLIDDRDPNLHDTPRGANPPFIPNHENSLGQSDFGFKLDSRENSVENNFFGVHMKSTFKENH